MSAHRMTHMTRMNPDFALRGLRPVAGAAALCCAIALSGCGGGGGSGDGANSADGSGNAPVTLASLQLKGVVASGKAWADAKVSAKCADGSVEPVTAGKDGGYAMTASNVTLPCLVRAESTDAQGAVLRVHAPVTGSAASQTVNLTPLTSYVVNRAMQTGSTAAFDEWTADQRKLLTEKSVSDAIASMQATMKSIGLPIDAVGNPISSALSAAHDDVQGDTHDQLLDSLNQRMAQSGISSAMLAAVIMKDGIVGAGSSTVAPPKDMLLATTDQPYCTSLRSGSYRLVPLGTDDAVQTIVIDAAARTIEHANARVEPLAPSPSGSCRYTGSGTEYAFTAGGAGVVRTGSGSAGTLALIMPRQNLSKEQLAGDLSIIVQDRRSSEVGAMQSSIDTSGVFHGKSWCGNLADCETDPSSGPVTVDSDGQIHLTTGEGTALAGYAYRTGSGAVLTVLRGAGIFALATPTVAVNLPAQGRVSESWNSTISLSGQASPIGHSGNTVTSVDAQARSWVRNNVMNWTTQVTRPETMLADTPIPGMTQRRAENVVASDGSSQSVATLSALTLRGTGLSAFASPGAHTLGLSWDKH